MQNISLNYWNDNSKLSALNSCVQNISSSYWQDSSKLNSLNRCVQNISLNYWNDNSNLSAPNSCVQNISSSYWNTNTSLQTVLQNYLTVSALSLSVVNCIGIPSPYCIRSRSYIDVHYNCSHSPPLFLISPIKSMYTRTTPSPHHAWNVFTSGVLRNSSAHTCNSTCENATEKKKT